MIRQYFQWDPPTYLSDPNIYNPIANAEDTITYCVTAKGYNGCIDTACITVYVLIPAPDIHIPNAFTPNGDGVNDYFLPIGYNITEFHMQIFNRWGQLVYETDDFEKGWNGEAKGVPGEIGAYVYYVVWQGKLDGVFDSGTLKGNVTLIR